MDGVWPKIRYSNECPYLPAARPTGYPRIVDVTSFDTTTDETDKTGLTGADGVATFLWKWDKAQFQRFFDLTQSKFDLHYQGPKGCIESMVISRNNREVIIGFRLGVGTDDIRWDPKLVYDIQEDGCWKGKSCWMNLQNGADPEMTAAVGILFTASLLSNKLWDLEHNVKDGEIRKVEVMWES